MHVSHPSSSELETAGPVDLRMGFLWGIALVAALGGLLFGYDWVVIGGAKPFYEAYFHLSSPAQIGWANSCALLGCLAGSLIAGSFSEHFGRKRVLIASGLLFATSSVLTGWSFHFSSFVAWRLAGGAAIGLASNTSPMYIAEISPAAWRGRLVSLNQLAIVVGILTAQIANWQIAQRAPDHLVQNLTEQAWNVQYGWRWMFTAVALPAVIFLLLVPFIPESPRWLATRNRFSEAKHIFSRIGGDSYANWQMSAMAASLAPTRRQSSFKLLRSRSMMKLLGLGIALVVLQQASGINVLFNYAEEIYKSAGYSVSGILFNIVVTGTINLLFTIAAMMMVDRFGRKRLLLFGCIGIGASHLTASLAYRAHKQGISVLVLTLCAIACYAMSMAPVTWVYISEIFPNRVRAEAISVTVGALWVASFVLTYTFPLLQNRFGTAGAFLTYASICLAGALFVSLAVPETKGRSLEELEVHFGQAAQGGETA